MTYIIKINKSVSVEPQRQLGYGAGHENDQRGHYIMCLILPKIMIMRQSFDLN